MQSNENYFFDLPVFVATKERLGPLWELSDIEWAVYHWALNKPTRRNFGNPEIFHA